MGPRGCVGRVAEHRERRLQRRDRQRPAFLFGRRTYEIFAGYWGAMADPSTNPIAAALNSRPKYVVSTSIADPSVGAHDCPARRRRHGCR